MNPALTPEQSFLINYKNSPTLQGQETSISMPSIGGRIDLDYVSSAQSVLDTLPFRANQTHVVYTKIQKLARNRNVPLGYFNQTSWEPQQEPRIPLISLARNRWDSNQFAISTGLDPVWVDLVVNNLDEGAHPFHLVSVFQSSVRFAYTSRQ